MRWRGQSYLERRGLERRASERDGAVARKRRRLRGGGRGARRRAETPGRHRAARALRRVGEGRGEGRSEGAAAASVRAAGQLNAGTSRGATCADRPMAAERLRIGRWISPLPADGGGAAGPLVGTPPP